MRRQVNPYAILGWLACACVLFIAYGSLLPFDFHARAPTEIWSLIMQGDRTRAFFSLTDRAVNVIIGIPLGFFAFGALARPGRFGRNAIAGFTVFVLSVGLAAAVEFLQIFLPARSASYGDIMAQALGSVLGIIGWGIFGTLAIGALRALSTVRPAAAKINQPLSTTAKLAAPIYVLLLFWVNGWFTGEWLSAHEAARSFRSFYLLPFYYHSEASIFRAASSTLAVLVEYAPIGLLYRFAVRPPHRVGISALIAGAVALVIESGKLFLLARHPDSANVLLASLSSGAACALWSCVGDDRRLDQDTVAPFAEPYPENTALRGSQRVALPRLVAIRTISIAIFIFLALAVSRYPVGTAWLAALIALYSVALLRFPTFWLIVLPALLPCFDFSPWTGWFFLDEFDFFVLATIGCGLWLCAAEKTRTGLSLPLKFLLLGLGASLLFSLLIGLLPLEPLNANAFANYYSRYNALRCAKGFVMALGLLPLLLYNLDAGTPVIRLFTAGMVIGLFTVIGAGIWERAAFPGLFDFAKDYRISALFSTMHTGDAPIETYLVTALPFAIAWAHEPKTFTAHAVALLAFVLGTYVLFVTFSRGGYFGYVVMLAVLITGGLLIPATHSEAYKRAFIFLLMVAVIVAGIAGLFVLESSFPRSRLATTEVDAITRFGHWRNVLRMMDSDWLTSLAGMGLGRYPETDLKKNWTTKMPSSYSYLSEGGNRFLRVSSGVPTYLEQIIEIEPGRRYTIALDLRSAPRPGTLNAMICQRSFFRSYNCKDGGVWPSNGQNQWTHREVSIDSGPLGSGPWYLRRTVKFILENTSQDNAVDIDNVRVIDDAGINHLANGDFAGGHDRWFFSSGDHLHWHIKNIWVQIFFEQGLLGVFFFVLFVSFAVACFAKGALSGEFVFSAMLASVVGFLCVGLFASPLDAPRLAFLFYLLGFGGLICVAAPKRARESAPAPMPFKDQMPTPVLVGAQQPTLRSRTESATQPSVADGSIWELSRLRLPALQVCAGVLSFVALAWLVMHSPLVPYNVRDLLHPVHPIASLTVFALYLYWSAAVPVLIGFLMIRSSRVAWSYSLLLLFHSILAWFLLTYAVNFDRIHKIVGSPVLNWHWYWEPAGRFVALFSAFSLSMTAAALLVFAFVYRRKSAAAVLAWLTTSVVLSPCIYWVVVTQAGTDNLVELMAGGGTPMAALFLSLFVIVVFFGGSSVAAQLQSIRSGIRPAVILAVLLSIPLAYVLFTLGTESVGSSRVDLQACKLEYSIVSPK